MYTDPGLADEIRSLVTETLLVNVESADTDLLATGLLDSLRLIDLLTQLEQRFNVRFDCQSLEFDDLRSPAMLAALVARYSDHELKMHDPELSKIAQTLQELPFPTKFAVEVTAHCNLACAMCHHPAMQRPKGRMPLELWKRCVGGGENVCHFGGQKSASIVVAAWLRWSRRQGCGDGIKMACRPKASPAVRGKTCL